MYLDVASSNAVATQSPLDNGRSYIVTMQGTYTVWYDIGEGAANAPGKPDPSPMYPSDVKPAGQSGKAGIDPVFHYSWPVGWFLERQDRAPFAHDIVLMSLADAAGLPQWEIARKYLDPGQGYDATTHRYKYTVIGNGSPLRVKTNELVVKDNYGRIRISITPEQ